MNNNFLLNRLIIIINFVHEQYLIKLLLFIKMEKNEKIQDLSDFEKAKQSVLVKSENTEFTEVIKGYDFNLGIDYDKIFKSYNYMGFQSTNLSKAIDIINNMITWRLKDDPLEKEESEDYKDLKIREKTRTTIFLGYTSNMISSGLREIIRYLCEHKMVDVIVTTAGGVEEDFIKCLAPTFKGQFELNGENLRNKGFNRIGNLIVPNDNYCKFEDWVNPLLEKMRDEQEKNKVNWTPSKIIDFLGKEIDNKDSVYYWCHKNNIPVFCPAITDGSLGDMIFFSNYSDTKTRLRVDIVEDIVKLNKIALKAKKTGSIILGGGLVKHHINNANLMRNGTDYAVYINTGQEYDGSDAGARPDEAVSWGKIKIDAEMVKVYAEVSLVLPIIVAQTFAKRKEEFLDK